MKTNKIFSFSRFMNVMKYDLGSNWKGYLYSFLSITGVFLLCYLLGFLFIGSKGNADLPTNNTNSIILFIGGAMGVVTPFLFYIGAGRMLKMMRTKEGRISFLMLPATRLEKFISRALLSTLGVFLLVVLAIIAADMLRFVFHPMFSLPASMSQLHFPALITEVFCSPFSIFGSEQVEAHAVILRLEWLSVACVLWGHSMFILGGTIFVKHPVLKTFGCLFLLFLILSNLVINIKFGDFVSSAIEDGQTFMVVSTVVFSVLFLFNWWLSYHLFSIAQIIRKKLF